MSDNFPFGAFRPDDPPSDELHPMSSAPRDGTYITVFVRARALDIGAYERRYVYWCDEAGRWAAFGVAFTDRDMERLVGWKLEEDEP